MNKPLFIASVLVGIFTNIASYKIGSIFDNTPCVNSADILNADTNDILSFYIPNELGIAHVYFAYNEIYFENGGDPLEFTTRDAMYDYIENMTAYNSSTIGYQGDLDYNIRNGYIYARTVYNDNEQYTDLVYNGPNWAINAECDTTYLISTFNNVEKIYNPSTKSIEYDHYSID